MVYFNGRSAVTLCVISNWNWIHFLRKIPLVCVPFGATPLAAELSVDMATERMTACI